MREILGLLPKPSHYLGAEWGVVRKPLEGLNCHMALAFPDLYEVGMSYLGQKILLEAVNVNPGLFAERVFTPSREAAQVMRERGVKLCTLESGTELGKLDLLAFHLTTELCYDTTLFMLDLAGLPLEAGSRGEDAPLVLAGGGCAFNPEPMALFFDAFVLGDGEDILPRLAEFIGQARKKGRPKAEILGEISKYPGVYVPSLYSPAQNGEMAKPLAAAPSRVGKAVVCDLDKAAFPSAQIVPLGQAVHDRLALEVARGCTRGCRFCQAGMIYRPVRERSLEKIDQALKDGLAATGFEEISYLSLSTGDFSDLDGLFRLGVARCLNDQVAISLPSLRAGTLTDSMLSLMAKLRRTGATLAPEAATQRLRDVINKGISEEDILGHARRLFERGWQSLKLYFMIGLPTETREDQKAILDLCLKVLDAAGGKVKRLNVTAAISPFVPKPHTPFQWQAQKSRTEISEDIAYIRSLFAPHKRLSLRWHEPSMSWLEGVLARGGRELGPAIAEAYRRGALFSAWVDGFNLAPWMEGFKSQGLEPEAYLAARDVDSALPWEHLSSGVHREFLLRELAKAVSAKITPDCRFGLCQACGVCNHKSEKSELALEPGAVLKPLLNRPEKDLEPEAAPLEEALREDLTQKSAHYRVWFSKLGPAVYLSQLELSRLFERAMRRAGIKPSFSSGFHPMPLLSFGWALPVSVASLCEWFALFLREDPGPEELVARLNQVLPEGLSILAADRLGEGKRVSQPEKEEFELRFAGDAGACLAKWREFAACERFEAPMRSKSGEKIMDLRPFLESFSELEPDRVKMVFTWKDKYLSPLRLVMAITPGLELTALRLLKTRQIFATGPR